jgi:hypothetical protein
MEKNDILTKIVEDPDYIKSPKYGNSLNKFLAKVEKIPDDKAIARLLMISVPEVEKIYQEAIVKLREGIDADEYYEDDKYFEDQESET